MVVSSGYVLFVICKQGLTGAQDSFHLKDRQVGADTAPPFYFLRAHHPLTRNRHAPPFAEYITSYGLHPPSDRRQYNSRNNCGS